MPPCLAGFPAARHGCTQAEWALPRILPQVRWHGRKEYMESLEPVAPVAAAAEAAARRTPEEERAAELVQAAEGQVTELRRRLEATSELLRAAAKCILVAPLERLAPRQHMFHTQNSPRRAPQPSPRAPRLARRAG